MSRVLTPTAPVFDWLARLDAPPGPATLDLSCVTLHGPGMRALLQELAARGIEVLVAHAVPDAGGQPALAPEKAAELGKIIGSSVRSGQRIECPGGDLTVIGSVASGAELVAAGSIHVYGALRGRALAGQMQTDAQIFARRLEAELLAIGGVFLAADDMDPDVFGRPIRAWAENGVVRISTMD